MTSGGEITFKLRHSLSDPTESGWLFVPLSVGQDAVLEMLPHPFWPRSSISRRALDELAARGLVSTDAPSYHLRDLRIVGQPVPDIDVRLGAAAGLLRADGIVGLDFFGQFRRITFDVDAAVMTLVEP